MNVGQSGRFDVQCPPIVQHSEPVQFRQAVFSIASNMAEMARQLGPLDSIQNTAEIDQARRAWTHWQEDGPSAESNARFQACLRLDHCLQAGHEGLALFDLDLSEAPPCEALPRLSPPRLMGEACRVSGLNPWKELSALRIVLPRTMTRLSEQIAKPAVWLVQRFIQRLSLEKAGLLASRQTWKQLDAMRRFQLEPDRLQQETTPLQVAKALLHTVRDDVYIRGFKSSNKFRPGLVESTPSEAGFHWLRSDLAQASLHALRAKYPYVTESSIWALFKAKGHNCEELSALGAAILGFAHFDQQCQLEFVAEDHNVLLVGANTVGQAHALNDLPVGAAICDPWANIATPATVFQVDYINKMKKWTGNGKLVFDVSSESWHAAYSDDLESRLQQGIKAHGAMN